MAGGGPFPEVPEQGIGEVDFFNPAINTVRTRRKPRAQRGACLAGP